MALSAASMDYSWLGTEIPPSDPGIIGSPHTDYFVYWRVLGQIHHKKTSMYKLAATIPNNGPACLIPEIAFHPDGAVFAVAYLENNKVCLYNTADQRLARTFENPAAALDKPHGVLLTSRHLIVANRHLTDSPATLTVYRLNCTENVPVFTLKTPLKHLREGHSMAMRDNILVITHPQNAGSVGAVVSYQFDDDTGAITGSIDHREAIFDSLGMTKGIAFTPDGGQVLINFNADKELSQRQRLAFKLFKARNTLEEYGLRGLVQNKLAGKSPLDRPKAFLKNGIAMFDLDADGHFSEKPTRVLVREEFCRYENIAINGSMVALSDTINHRVHLFDYDADPDLEHPVQTIAENLSLPHGVQFSPNGRLLVVSNYGLRNRDQLIHWGHFTNPRSDNVMVFESHAS